MFKTLTENNLQSGHKFFSKRTVEKLGITPESGKPWLPSKWGEKGKIQNLKIVILLIDYHSPDEMLNNKVSGISVEMTGVKKGIK